MLLVFGIFQAVIGLLLIIAHYKNWQKRKRILATPTSPIRQAPGIGPVGIKGRILPSEQGLLQAPFSGRPAVWYRVTVDELREGYVSNSYWKQVFHEFDKRAFVVDDGSGQVARVIPNVVTCVVNLREVATSGTFHDATPQLEAFLASHGLQSRGFFGFNKTMRYREEILVPGDTVYAVGPSRRDPGPPVSDGYREAPSTQLVLFSGDGPDGELILTNESKKQLIRKVSWEVMVGLVFVGVGAIMSLVAVVMRLSSAILPHSH
ncbi:MAG: E3 ubiquitin ligase family protein [Polyangiaceae bacterium]|nr:E3 ubiquitin ligase family protein [Polyangiaceae bacterium]